MTNLLPILEPTYPENAGYYCICEECECKEGVEYVDQVCSACYVGSHQEKENEA